MELLSSIARRQSFSQGKNLLAWQAFFIAALTATGYGLAYVYELGFNDEFGIPPNLILLNLTTILVTIGGILAIALAVFTIICVVYLFSLIPKFKRCQSTIHREIPLIGLLGFMSGLWWVYPLLWPEVILMAVMVIWFAFMRLMQERKRRQGKVDEFPQPVSDFFRRYLTRRRFVAFSLLAFIFIAAFFSGKGDARSQIEFLIPTKYQDCVVLRMYGDNLICARFDKEEQEVERRMFILRADFDPDGELVLSPVGPLKVVYHLSDNDT